MAAREIESYLLSLPVSDIANVELIRNPGPEYASDGLPVLNIVTKNHQDDGYNAYANLQGNYWHYLQGNLNARLNLNQGISRSYISYSLVQTRTRETTEYFGLSKTDVDVFPRLTHQLSLGSMLQLGKYNLLDVNLYATMQDERLLYYYGPGLVNENRLSRPRVFTSIQHTYSQNKLELRTTVEGSWASLNQKALANIPLNLRDHSGFLRINPNMTYSLTSQTQLLVGIFFEHSIYHNAYLSAGSNFRFSEYQASGFLGFNHSWKSVYLAANLEALSYNTHKISQNEAPLHNQYLFWLPRLTLTYEPAKKHMLALELRSFYQRPDFRDLTPIRTQSTNLWNRYGNITLNPARNYNLAARYSFMQAAMLEFDYSETYSPIMEQPIVADASAISLRKINLQLSRYFWAIMVLPVPLAQKKHFTWYASTTGALHYQKDHGILNAKAYQQHFLAYYVNHRHDISVGTWTIWVSATIYGPLFYGLYRLRETWWPAASIAKRIGAWRISAQLRDHFNTNIIRGSYLQLAQPLTFLRNWHQPTVSLMISYNFGNHALKKYRGRQHSDQTDRMRSEGNESIARDTPNQ